MNFPSWILEASVPTAIAILTFIAYQNQRMIAKLDKRVSDLEEKFNLILSYYRRKR